MGVASITETKKYLTFKLDKEVFEMPADRIDPPPGLGQGLNAAYIKGMGRRENEFVIILDIDRIFSADELKNVHRAGNSMETPDASGMKDHLEESEGYIKHV